MNKIRIAIADDHTLVRQTIAKTLSLDRKLEVVIQAENGRILLEQLEKEPVDVIILDIEMPVMNGFDVLDALRTRESEARVIILSMHFDTLVIKDLINRGARGLLPKNADIESLLNAIHEVRSAGYFFSKKVNPHLVQELVQKKSIVPTFAGGNLDLQLDLQETRILDYICRDKLNKEIAELLQISERTVERIRSKLCKMAGVKTSAGLVLFAMKHNYFVPDAGDDGI